MAYKNLKIYPVKRKLEDEWFIRWDELNPETGKWESKRDRGQKGIGGLNRCKTLKQKTAAANALLLIKKALLDAKGRDPRKHTMNDPGQEIGKMPILDALSYAFDKHKIKLGHKPQHNYKWIMNSFYASIKSLGFDGLQAMNFKRAHIRLCFDKMLRDGKSPTNVNNQIAVVKTCFEELEDLEVYEISPMAKFKKYKSPPPKQRRMMTDDEIETVYNYFQKVNPNFNNLWQLIYYSSVRGSECLALQVKNYDANKRLFVIHPDETITYKDRIRKKIKTNLLREIHVPPQMHKILQSMVLGQYPPDYFIFGRGFKPGAIAYGETQCYLYWKYHVIKKLKIDATLYPIKHKGLQDKRKAGISAGASQYIAGHARAETTRIYTKEREQEIYRNEIDLMQPDFLPKGKK